MSSRLETLDDVAVVKATARAALWSEHHAYQTTQPPVPRRHERRAPAKTASSMEALARNVACSLLPGKQPKETAMAQEPPLNPGDEAEPGAPGTGEDICPDCNGSGKLDGADCKTCGGTGKVTQGIGGG
jgi:hypothetical protein